MITKTVQNVALGAAVNDILRDLLVDGKRRCHEIARLMPAELEKHGFPGAIVRNGVIEYGSDYLRDRALEQLGLGEGTVSRTSGAAEAACQNTGKNKKLNVLSSWIELDDIRIAHESLLRCDKDTTLLNLLVIGAEEELAGKVDFHITKSAEFHAFGDDFLYISPRAAMRPFYVTRLRH